MPVMEGAVEVLREFEVPFEVRVLSAHRTPDDALDFARQAAGRGRRVLIAGAGGAAHLAGVLAAVTPLPVIGVPIAVGELGGLDSLLAMVQMPRGVPVATVAVNGARNAGLLAVRILALADERLAAALARHRDDMAVRGAGRRRGDPDPLRHVADTARTRTRPSPRAKGGGRCGSCVSGASGLIGRALLRRPCAAAGHEVVALVRRPPGPGEARWDPAAGSHRRRRPRRRRRRRPPGRCGHRRPPLVAGAPAEILGSRVGVHRRCSPGPWPGSSDPPAVLVSASAVGWYGDRGDEVLTEDERPGAPGSWPRCVGPGRGATAAGRGGRASGSSTCARASCWRPAAAPWRASCRSVPAAGSEAGSATGGSG